MNQYGLRLLPAFIISISAFLLATSNAYARHHGHHHGHHHHHHHGHHHGYYGHHGYHTGWHRGWGGWYGAGYYGGARCGWVPAHRNRYGQWISGHRSCW